MFVFSVKSNKIKACFIFLVAAAICVFGIYTALSKDKSPAAVQENGAVSLRASDNEQRVSFFSQFGWEVDEDPVEVREIYIPEDFDDEYEKYNDIQKQQDLDLSHYKSQTAKKWTYNIKNYPGYEDTQGCVEGNLIVYNGNVIAGDISCLDSENKFVRTFDFPKEESTTKAGEEVENKN